MGFFCAAERNLATSMRYLTACMRCLASPDQVDTLDDAPKVPSPGFPHGHVLLADRLSPVRSCQGLGTRGKLKSTQIFDAFMHTKSTVTFSFGALVAEQGNSAWQTHGWWVPSALSRRILSFRSNYRPVRFAHQWNLSLPSLSFRSLFWPDRSSTLSLLGHYHLMNLPDP